MELEDLKIGMVVCIIDTRLNNGGFGDVDSAVANPNTPFGKPAIIITIQDKDRNPGKWVGLCLKEEWPLAHECDGLTPKGHGWWSRPEYLYTPTARDVHEKSTEVWRKQKAAAQALSRTFIGRETMTITADDIGLIK